VDTAAIGLAAVLAVTAAVLVGLALRSRAKVRSRHPGDAADDAGPLAPVNAEASRLVAGAREEALAAREAALEELGARHDALEAAQQRLAERNRQLDERRRLADERRARLDERRAAQETARAELAERLGEADRRREEIAGMDRPAAAAAVLARVEAELATDHPGRVQRALAGRLGDLGPTATMLITDAIQRQDASHVDSAPRAATLSLEGLGDEARTQLLDALAAVGEETATDLALDPERDQVVLRGLDPVGREVARQASLEVLDRRLRAQEVSPLLLQTRRGLQRRIVDLGERALWEMGVDGRPELAELLGVLHYRFSYGQNALLHCQETGHLCAVLASELRLDPVAARSAGLLHDIGKAVDHDIEGSHAIIGGELLTVLDIDPGIVHAVKAHHFDDEPATDLAMLTICADAISASRPGARRDTLTTYLQRLDQLQQIATRHTGVERAYPMQAGREVRIAVRPDQVSDARVAELCAEIAREIEAEMTYPGMIKVTVIREITATATAS
jgi:ribonuclease Y